MAHGSTRQHVIDGINDQIQQNSGRANGHQLRLHQLDSLNDVRDWLVRDIEPSAPNNTPGLQGKCFDGGTVDMATGTGKTWVQLAIAAGAVARGEKVVIASPRLRINAQIQEAAEHPERFGLPPGSVARYDDDATTEERQRVINGTAPVILTTPAGLRNLDRDGIISPNPQNERFRGLIELDESDLFDGFHTGRVVRKYRDNSVVLGFSATNFDTNARLFDNQPAIHELPIHDTQHPERGAVRRGLLVPGIKTSVLEVTPNEGDILRIVQEARSQVEISEEAAEEFARNRAVINEVIRFHGGHSDEHLGPVRRLPTLITVPTIAAATQVADAFNEAYGCQIAAAVSSNTPAHNVTDAETGAILREGLDSLLERFNQGNSDLRVLVYPEVLGRGVDIPNAAVMISMRPYLRPAPVVQDLGRLTRRGTEDFEQRFGVPKNSVLAVNVQTPQMNPYLYSQVIGGPVLWESGPPRPYTPRGPTPPPPQMPPVQATVRSVTEYNELNRLYQDAETARRERQGIIPEGFITLEESVTRTGLTEQEIRRRLSNIDRGRQYTTLGLRPGTPGGDPEGTPTVRGEQLRRNIRGRTVLNEQMVERWRQLQDRMQRARDAGAVSGNEIATRHDVPVQEVNQANRTVERNETSAEGVGEESEIDTPPEVPPADDQAQGPGATDHRTRARRNRGTGRNGGRGGGSGNQ